MGSRECTFVLSMVLGGGGGLALAILQIMQLWTHMVDDFWLQSPTMSGFVRPRFTLGVRATNVQPKSSIPVQKLK
jgi:hypothetical protein